MSGFGGNAKETGVPNAGTAIFAPFEAWSEWLTNNMGNVTAPPGYWTGEEGQHYETAEEWRENAEKHEGTWWEDWIGWLEQRSGKQTDAPQEVGSDQYPPIEDAPGTYVREMHENEEEGEGA